MSTVHNVQPANGSRGRRITQTLAIAVWTTVQRLKCDGVGRRLLLSPTLVPAGFSRKNERYYWSVVTESHKTLYEHLEGITSLPARPFLMICGR